jgi:hypothetical protein
VESPARGRCPYCLGALQETLEAGGVVRCARCKTPHHGACFDEHTGCTIYGCGSRESLRGTADVESGLIIDTSAVAQAAAGAGALHPFLPLLQVDRPGRFLAVERPERMTLPARRRPRAPVLRLQLPTTVEADGRVTGSLEAIVPAVVLGQGLRLRVEAWLDGDAAPVLVGREEAVLVGRPGRGWLERLNLWARTETLLLASGRTRVRFAFDAAPWAWTAPLPEGTSWGPRLHLRVSAVLDASAGTSTRAHTITIRSARRPLEALQALVPARRPVDLPLWPPLPDPGWCARPLVVPAGEEVRQVGVFAARRAEVAVRTTAVGLALTAAAAAPGVPRVTGTVTLALKRTKQPLGPIVLSCEGERRLGDGPWQRVSRERALVCDSPPIGADYEGRHVFEFEYAPPWPERPPPEDEARRVRLRATMDRPGGDLKSATIAVVLRRRRRPVIGEAT